MSGVIGRPRHWVMDNAVLTERTQQIHAESDKPYDMPHATVR